LPGGEKEAGVPDNSGSGDQFAGDFSEDDFVEDVFADVPVADDARAAAAQAAAAAPIGGTGAESSDRTLLDFTDAWLRDDGEITDLVVMAEVPDAGLEVRFMPRRYVKQPDYWGITVMGVPTGDMSRPSGVYEASTSVTGTLGSQGVEVIGATRTLKLDKRGASLPSDEWPPISSI
jgi:hypothetical protein